MRVSVISRSAGVVTAAFRCSASGISPSLRAPTFLPARNVIALWDFCNAAEIFSRRHIGELILCSDVTQLPHSGNAWGRANMSIETVLLIVILTFGLGFVLNRWELGRGRFRRGSLRGGVWGRRRA
jgi:hypothetical protein